MPAVDEIYNRFVVFKSPWPKKEPKPFSCVQNTCNTRSRSRNVLKGSNLDTHTIGVPDIKPSLASLAQSVQVKIELGHKASLRRKSTTEGFTHDWTIFVRGPEGSNIQHFVEKCIFHLHDSFPKPKRVVKEPPYRVSESGYGSFNLPVEIYFKTKEEPRKIRFDYDLFLHLDGSPPVNHVRCEKLTFQNPTEEFRRKLIKAGGVGILGPNDGITITANPSSTTPPPVTTTTPQTAESKAFTELFGAPIQAEINPQSKQSEGSHSKKHKSHSKDKDRDRERSKSKSNSQPHSGLPPGAGGQSTPTSKVTTPPAGSNGIQDKSTKEKSKRTSEEISVTDIPAKKKKKDKDRERERESSKSSSGNSKDKERSSKDRDKSSKSSAVPEVKGVSADKSHDKEKEHGRDKDKEHGREKERHHHRDSSGSHSKSHKKSHKQRHGERSKPEEDAPPPQKAEEHFSPPSSKSPVKNSKSPSKSKEHSQSANKKPKSGSTSTAAPPAAKSQLPPLELSTGEASDYDPFDDDPPILSPDILTASQNNPKVSALADSRSKEFMKALLDEMDSDDAMDGDDDVEDMDIEVVTPPKVSPAKVSPVVQPVQPAPAPEPTEVLIPTQNSPRSHTPSSAAGPNSISPKLSRHGKPIIDNSKHTTPEKPHSSHSAESMKRHKSHTSPSSSSPLTLTSQRSRSDKEKDKSSSHKHRESSSSSTKKREGDHRERESKTSTAPSKKRDVEQDPSASSTPKSTAPVKKKETEVAKEKDGTWDGSPPSTGPARRRDVEPPREKDPAPPTWSGSQNTILAKSNKISPPRFSMDPPDLLKSTQHSDLFGFQSSQRSLPELEKENQGDNHVTNGSSSVSKTPLLENGTDIADTQLVPGFAPNGEAFDLLLALQAKLNATKDEAVLSEVIRILEDSGEVFSMTDASLDFDLCYLNSNTVHRLKHCLQLS